ncbi:hypothetical protein, partial [Nocardioides sp. KR10-350]|uniref:hypothetical protein n=1 Tax=Nocardioides cheoyonin TaxID=3156615 RepID=UPI0032B42E80
TAGPEHAALALATLPAAEKTETARLKGIREAEERRQREQHEEEDRQRKATAAAAAARGAANRRTFDWSVVVLAVGACVTVLVPWLIGRFALRDRFGRATSVAVFDPAVRKAGDYFLTDWLSGTCVILVVAGVVILAGRYWPRRILSIAMAFAMIGAALFYLRPIAISKWSEAEAHSAMLLETTAFPFSDRYKTCGSDTLTFTRDDGTKYVVSAFSAHISGTADEGCNRVEIYRGWCPVKTINLPSGAWIQDNVLGSSVSSNADDKSLPASQIVFLADLANDKTFKVPLKSVDTSKRC